MNIILDLHGTIIRDFPIEMFYKKIFEFIDSIGMEREVFERLKKLHMSGAKTFDKLGLKSKYIEILDSLPPTKYIDEEMVEILTNLNKKKYNLFLVTDSSMKNTLNTLEAAKIPSGLFKTILTIDKYEPKPSTEMYALVPKKKETIVIGDRLVDAVPALELGLPVFLGDYEQCKQFLMGLVL